MMPVSVRVGPIAAFGTFSGGTPEFVNKARGVDTDQGSMGMSTA
jgi:hypothetical protein